MQLCSPDRSWRAARLYRHIAEVRERHERGGAAIAVIPAKPEGKARTTPVRRRGLEAEAQVPHTLRKPASSPPPPML